ncbi:MAG: hypothetical protein F7B18_03715 [Desulfurococcales archaeon]|nr:hypothetical protein [Desulfurococcales archaeon]
MTPAELASAVERYLEDRTPIPGLMPDHQERLNRLVDTWCKRGGCEIHRLGDYILVYSKRAATVALDMLDDHAYIFLWKIASDTPIEEIESSYPDLNIAEILFLDKARRSLEESSGALVIGIDRDTNMVFAHELPWFITGLLGLARPHINEKLVRTMMGFDYNPWEELEGEGSIIRLQGDVAVRIVYQFQDDDEAVRWLAGGLVRYSLAKALYRAHLKLIEEILKEIQSLANSATTDLDTVYAISFAVARAISRVYGTRATFFGQEDLDIFLDSIISTTFSTIRGTVVDLNYPRAIKVEIDIDFNIESLRELMAKCLDTYKRPCMGLEDAGAALYRLIVLAKDRLNISINSIYMATREYYIIIDGLEPLLANIANIIDRQVEGIVEKLLSGSKLELDDGTILGKFMEEEVSKAAALLEPVEADLEVDRHRIVFNGYLVRDPFVSRALTLEYIAGIIDYLLSNKNIKKTFSSFKKLKRSKNKAELAMGLAKLLSVKNGTIYALITGDHTIEATHPEHGRTSLGLPWPALIEITSLNTNVNTVGNNTIQIPPLIIDDDTMPFFIAPSRNTSFMDLLRRRRWSRHSKYTEGFDSLDVDDDF